MTDNFPPSHAAVKNPVRAENSGVVTYLPLNVAIRPCQRITAVQKWILLQGFEI